MAWRHFAGREDLGEVLDFYAGPLFLEVFGDQAAMAMLGRFLAAEEAGALEFGLREPVFDVAGLYELEKLEFVFGPDSFFLFVGVEHVLAGGEFRDVQVIDIADGFAEVAQVFFFW